VRAGEVKWFSFFFAGGTWGECEHPPSFFDPQGKKNGKGVLAGGAAAPPFVVVRLSFFYKVELTALFYFQIIAFFSPTLLELDVFSSALVVLNLAFS